MLGLSPLAAAPLSDDGDRLPRITAGVFAPVVFGGSAAGEAISGGRSQAATLAVGRAISGVGDIHAQCADDINAAGNAAAILRIIGEAAGSIAATTTATVAFRSAASIQGDIGLSGQCAVRVKTAGTARHLWDLEGAWSSWRLRGELHRPYGMEVRSVRDAYQLDKHMISNDNRSRRCRA